MANDRTGRREQANTAESCDSQALYLSHKEQEAEVRGILQSELAYEVSAVHGILRSQDAAWQDAVMDEGPNRLCVVHISQHIILPQREEFLALCPALLHLHLFLFKEADVFLQEQYMDKMTKQICLKMHDWANKRELGKAVMPCQDTT